jgi:hypothetical protein
LAGEIAPLLDILLQRVSRVRQHWRAVRALGEALQERPELDGEEVKEIVFTAMPELRPQERAG